MRDTEGDPVASSFALSHQGPPFERRKTSRPAIWTWTSSPSFQPIASATRFGMVTIRVLPTRRSFISGGIAWGLLVGCL